MSRNCQMFFRIGTVRMKCFSCFGVKFQTITFNLYKDIFWISIYREYYKIHKPAKYQYDSKIQEIFCSLSCYSENHQDTSAQKRKILAEMQITQIENMSENSYSQSHHFSWANQNLENKFSKLCIQE